MLGFLGFALEGLAPLLNGGVNQVGDPYTPDAWDSGARAYEVAVLEYFAQVAGALPGEVCGYVASSSGEALLQGLAAAQRRLPEACVYASDQAHDSARRACELVRMELVTVGSLPGGRMDPEELRLQVLQRRGLGGAVVVATFGTTMRGAVDDVRVLRAAGGEMYVHVDAAGGGLVAAHTRPEPNWSFAHGADSLNVSGHPVLGVPVPAAGVSLVRRALLPEGGRGVHRRHGPDAGLLVQRSGLPVAVGAAAVVGACRGGGAGRPLLGGGRLRRRPAPAGGGRPGPRAGVADRHLHPAAGLDGDQVAPGVRRTAGVSGHRRARHLPWPSTNWSRTWPPARKRPPDRDGVVAHCGVPTR
ncbi:pyridoxal-dependent decarboxylase [Streptomyces fungicidicus]